MTGRQPDTRSDDGDTQTQRAKDRQERERRGQRGLNIGGTDAVHLAQVVIGPRVFSDVVMLRSPLWN